MQTGREVSLAKALISPAGVPASLLSDLSPSQWTSAFTFLLDSAFILFQSVSRLEVSDTHQVAKIEDSCGNAVEEVRRRIELAFQSLKTLLKSIPADKKVSVELETLQAWLNRLTEVVSQSILSAEAWRNVRDLELSGFSGLLCLLVKIAGEQLHNPAFYRLVAVVCQQVGSSCASLSKLLCVALYRVGPLFADLAEAYIGKFAICEKTLETLRLMTNSTDITLNVAKKMRSRKLGNSHQKRSQKNSMRRDEAKKLQEIERQVSFSPLSQISSSELSANLRLLLAFAVSEECPGLQAWLSLDWTHLPEETQSHWLELVLASVIRSRKGVRKLERILEKTAETASLSAQSRHAMFVLSQLSEVVSVEETEEVSEPQTEVVSLAILDPDN